jgi:predicted anti-sigma-YlaC factor YlaD
MSELRCDHVVEMVTDFLEGVLDPADERDLVEHLNGCDGCSDYVEQYRRAVRTLGELPAADSTTLTPEARAALLEVFRRTA